MTNQIKFYVKQNAADLYSSAIELRVYYSDSDDVENSEGFLAKIETSDIEKNSSKLSSFGFEKKVLDNSFQPAYVLDFHDQETDKSYVLTITLELQKDLGVCSLPNNIDTMIGLVETIKNALK
jgi:hypothetical protein